MSHKARAISVASVLLLLTAAASNASANSLSLSSDDFSVVFTPMKFIGGGSEVRCDVTLTGSYHSSTIAKSEQALIGFIVHASIGNCTGGTATVLAETLPWHIVYEDFEGSLPEISGIGAGISPNIQIDPEGTAPDCLYGGTEVNRIKLIKKVIIGIIVIWEIIEALNEELPVEGDFLCQFATASVAGNGAVTEGEGAELSVTLI